MTDPVADRRDAQISASGPEDVDQNSGVPVSSADLFNIRTTAEISH
jgi:hypothetical protein